MAQVSFPCLLSMYPLAEFMTRSYLPDSVFPWRARCEDLGKKMDRLYIGEYEARPGYTLFLSEDRFGGDRMATWTRRSQYEQLGV
jgi:hypothetical protein